MHGDDGAGGGAQISPAGPSAAAPSRDEPPADAAALDELTTDTALLDEPAADAAIHARIYARPSGRARRLLVYLAVTVLAATAGVGTTLVAQHLGGARPSAAAPTPRAAAADQRGAMNDEAVYNEVEPGIVDVAANLGYLQETAEGTGVVIDAAAGLVLTNNHVIDGATSVTVTLVTSGKSYPARVLGYDMSHDIALLQVRGAAGLKAVAIGDSSHLKVGMPVLAIGNEAGQGGSPTVAPGVISSLDRTIVASDQASSLTETLYGMMQTNADIRPGDSGGPLADAAGQVVGIDTAAGGGKDYSGYAIPIEAALPIVRQIAAGRPSAHIQIGLPALLGVLMPSSTSTEPSRQASHELRQTGGPGGSSRSCTSGDTTGIPASIAPARSGALVDGVLCGTPAAAAGISAGDVITSMGGRAVTTPASLNALVSHYRPGSKASLAWVSPGGSRHAAVVTLGAAPAG